MTIFGTCCATAEKRGFTPEFILFDSWHADLENLKLIRSLGRKWLTRLVHNRHVNPDRTGNRPINQVNATETGSFVHFKGYGMIKVFKIVKTDADIALSRYPIYMGAEISGIGLCKIIL